MSKRNKRREKKARRQKKAVAKAAAKPLRLDLGCGPNKRTDGEWVGVDVLPFDGKVDMVMDIVRTRAGVQEWQTLGRPKSDGYDLFERWPWADNSVDEVNCSHFLEHLERKERVFFFNELYRVMKPEAKAQITIPHWASNRSYGDLTHSWPPVAEMLWYYLDKNWRSQNAPHLCLNCDFNVTWGYTMAQPWPSRAPDVQAQALAHYREVAQDMIATCAKRKPEPPKP